MVVNKDIRLFDFLRFSLDIDHKLRMTDLFVIEVS